MGFYLLETEFMFTGKRNKESGQKLEIDCLFLNWKSNLNQQARSRKKNREQKRKRGSVFFTVWKNK